ncbi:hypothetical protein [Nonomuraea sp. NPDC003754]
MTSDSVSVEPEGQDDDEPEAEPEPLEWHPSLLYGVPGYGVFVDEPPATPYRSTFDEGAFVRRVADLGLAAVERLDEVAKRQNP